MIVQIQYGYEEFIGIWLGDPLENGEHRLLKAYGAKGVTTKVRGKPIEDFAVLKEGTDTWGWKHIWEKHKEQFRKFYAKPDQLGRELSDEELMQKMMEDIENALRYGERVKIDDITVEFRYGNIRVRVSMKEGNEGSIITAFPKTRGG